MHFTDPNSQEVSFAFIVVWSDTTSHNAAVFHGFKHEILTDAVEKQFKFITEIIYASDDAGSQYKHFLHCRGLQITRMIVELEHDWFI